MEHNMFCYQCQETAGCSGCTRVGVCGKQPDVAAMQDLLVYVTKGLSAVTTALRAQGESVEGEVNHLITLNLFTTITNANFDKTAIEERIRTTLAVKEKLLPRVKDAGILPQAALWDGSDNWEQKAKTVGVLSTENEDIRSLRELITYGLKGLSAYSKHANALMQDDEDVDAFLQRALAATLDDNLTADDLVALTLETGKHGVSGMALLDKANSQAYGNPEITKVSIGAGKNPGILVSGHDLRDLEMLLEQTQGTGVDAQLGHGGDGEGTDVQRGALRVGDPVLLHFHNGLHGLNEVLHGDLGDAQAVLGVVHAAGVAVRAEQLDLTLSGAIGLHTLEALLSIVEHHGGGIQGDGGIGDDPGIMPALALVIVHDEHVIGENFAEPQLALVGGLGLGRRGLGDLDIQHLDTLLL